MQGGWVLGLVALAGGALVVQNLLMARMTEAMSSILLTLILNSVVGLVALCVLLLRQSGLSGLAEGLGAFRLWFLLPGVLGSFFVFASITGYQHLGAATTIALLVASQLVLGLSWDALSGTPFTTRDWLRAALGAAFLLAGAVLIMSRGHTP